MSKVHWKHNSWRCYRAAGEWETLVWFLVSCPTCLAQIQLLRTLGML